MIVFFSTAVSVLYYLGAMQFIIRNIARGLASVLGTSPAESLNAAGNIFLGQVRYCAGDLLMFSFCLLFPAV